MLDLLLGASVVWKRAPEKLLTLLLVSDNRVVPVLPREVLVLPAGQANSPLKVEEAVSASDKRSIAESVYVPKYGVDKLCPDTQTF